MTIVFVFRSTSDRHSNGRVRTQSEENQPLISGNANGNAYGTSNPHAVNLNNISAKYIINA